MEEFLKFMASPAGIAIFTIVALAIIIFFLAVNYRFFAKAFLDFLFGLIFFVIISPATAVCAVIVKKHAKKVCEKHWIVGKGGKPVGLRHEPLDKVPPKPAGHDAARREMAANQVRELLTRYGKIDVMWFDGGQREISNEEIRRLQPGIVINRRNGELGDFGDSEGVLPTHRPQGWFECNDPCWPSRWWSYSCSDRMDSGADVIEKLVVMRAWGGNFLANVGPGPDGAMPPEALAAWKEMAAWMRHSGESVHDVTGGGFPETANQPVTVRGDGTLYVHAFPNFHKAITVRDLPKRPVRATLLRTGDAIPFTYDNATLTLQIPPRLRSRMVDTVRVSLQ